MAELQSQSSTNASIAKWIIVDDVIANRFPSWDFARTFAPSLPLFLSQIDRIDASILALSTTLKAKVGTFARWVLIGNQSVTGVGFTPKLLVVFATPNTGNISGSIGATDGTNNQCYITNHTTWTETINANLINIIDNAANNAIASIVSFDADWFTVNWTTSLTAADCFYVCIWQ